MRLAMNGKRRGTTITLRSISNGSALREHPVEFAITRRLARKVRKKNEGCRDRSWGRHYSEILARKRCFLQLVEVSERLLLRSRGGAVPAWNSRFLGYISNWQRGSKACKQRASTRCYYSVRRIIFDPKSRRSARWPKPHDTEAGRNSIRRGHQMACLSSRRFPGAAGLRRATERVSRGISPRRIDPDYAPPICS